MREELDEPLFSYFEKNIKERKEQVQEFCQRFLAFSRERRTPELKKWWAEYLYTKEFQEIKWQMKIAIDNLRVQQEENKKRWKRNFLDWHLSRRYFISRSDDIWRGLWVLLSKRAGLSGGRTYRGL